jgi:magnesium transporter
MDPIREAIHHPFTRLRIMGRIVRRAVKRPGTPPGTVVHSGIRRVETPHLHRIRYGPDAFEEVDVAPDGPLELGVGGWGVRAAGGAAAGGAGAVDAAEAAGGAAGGAGVVWLNVDGLHDVSLLERIGAEMGIHPLAMEDVANVGQRPKLEEYDAHLFVVLHMLRLREGTHVEVEQVSFLVGDGYLISFQEAPGDVFEPVRARLRSGKGRLRARGADFLAYALMDAVVDASFEVLEGLGERTEVLETEVLERPTPATMRAVHELKRELLVLRRSVWPLRELMGAFLRVDGPLVQEGTRLYLRDVYDHSHHLLDTVELLRDMSSGMQDLYLSSVSNRTNEVMKVLTIMASIFIPLTFVAGVYGMNFEHMPELAIPWAYPAVLAGMAAAGLGMAGYFRHRRWL